jgi:tRNA threonylcarbamoyladenosine biosynthesis protein TsaB
MLLAIDTATPTLSIALYDGHQVRAEHTWTTVNRHTVELTPAIQRLMTDVKIAPADLTLLAVSQGPGSFNGLRIGFSVAKGMAMGLNLPLITVPTLDITASMQSAFRGNLLAVAQAGRGRLVACTYRWRKPEWISLNDTRIDSWQNILMSIQRETLITGEVDEAGKTAIAASDKPIQLASPASMLRRAGYLAEIAWIRWHDDPTLGHAAAANPIYLHQPGVPHP